MHRKKNNRPQIINNYRPPSRQSSFPKPHSLPRLNSFQRQTSQPKRQTSQPKKKGFVSFIFKLLIVSLALVCYFTTSFWISTEKEHDLHVENSVVQSLKSKKKDSLRTNNQADGSGSGADGIPRIRNPSKVKHVQLNSNEEKNIKFNHFTRPLDGDDVEKHHSGGVGGDSNDAQGDINVNEHVAMEKVPDHVDTVEGEKGMVDGDGNMSTNTTTVETGESDNVATSGIPDIAEEVKVEDEVSSEGVALSKGEQTDIVQDASNANTTMTSVGEEDGHGDETGKYVTSGELPNNGTSGELINSAEEDNNKEEAILTDEELILKAVEPVVETHNETEFNACNFRTYDSIRYYKVNETKESFLSDAQYIRGQLPFVLNQDSSEQPTKVCMNTSEWENVQPGRYPFSDGQNPSVVSLRTDPYELKDNSIPERLVRSNIEALVKLYGEAAINNYYLGLMLFGEAQCKWGMSEDEIQEKRFSPLPKFPGKRTVLMILNEDFQVIEQAPLELEHDDDWGDKRQRFPRKESSDGEGFERSIVELDDARLFFHDGKLFVLYRNGPSFGYEKQLQNQIHFEAIGDDKYKAKIKASETFDVCCGRNIAFASEEGNLAALTWVDPVTLINVTIPSPATSSMQENAATVRRRLLNSRRRLRKKEKKSSIHGTNGYLIPLHSTSEVLGIAHFHRPDGRDKNDFARFGHHYTHAFFTIKKEKVTNSDGKSETKHTLSRLSNEFVFSSPSVGLEVRDKTGDIIQFASGLDLVGSDEQGKLLISYGINDCESALLNFPMKSVQEMLVEVSEGQEVFHLMDKLESPSSVPQ